jgi:hypothetical protein
MYTGDPYKSMEVRIISGVHKGIFGTVISSREKDGQTFVNVVTNTHPIQWRPCLKSDDVREFL